jgi:3-phenylpropionate/trans-cinnamate dioxygenase ferredoxin component
MAQFVKVAKMSELPEHDGSLEEVEGKGTLVEIEGKRIALFNLDGEVFAIDDTCTHESGPLIEDVASYKVRITDDDVEVEV